MKRVFIVVIYIAIVMAIIGGYLIKKDYDLTKNIEETINLSEEEKSKINYDALIEDIKSAERGSSKFNAKKVSENNINERNGSILRFGSSIEYQGEGYNISFASGEYVTDVGSVYTFSLKDKYIYHVSSGSWGTSNIFLEIFKIRYDILYFLISIVIVVVISIIILKKRKSMKNES